MKNILFAVLVALSIPTVVLSQTLFGYDTDETKPPEDMVFSQKVEYEDDGEMYVQEIYRTTKGNPPFDEVEYSEIRRISRRKMTINYSFLINNVTNEDYNKVYDRIANLLDGYFPKEVDKVEKKYTWIVNGVFHDGIIVFHWYQNSLIVSATKYYHY